MVRPAIEQDETYAIVNPFIVVINNWTTIS